MRPLPGMICAIGKARREAYETVLHAPIPSVLSIAGSDSCGGAGIQADIKTISAHMLYAQTAITALTAQNTTGVFGIYDVSPEFAKQQIDTVFADMRPQAVKIGMLSSAGIAAAVADALEENGAANIVLDPVMVSTSGSSLMAEDTVKVLFSRLFPLADLVTPNLPEAQAITGEPVACEADMIRAAKKIHAMMRRDSYVLVKGGHLADSANDLLFGPEGEEWIRGERVETQNSHGTGCSLSSAIACGLAKGLSMSQSAKAAKAYLAGALSHDPCMGLGNGPLDHMWEHRFR